MTENEYPKTVTEMLEWKKIGKFTVENLNSKYTKECGGQGCTDVLYSFLGIYSLGIYACEPDVYDVTKNRIIVKESRNGRKYQLLNSKDYLLKIQENPSESVLDINKFLEENFIKYYFKVGNLIPMWPGGNTKKGNQNNGYMDIPELFFYDCGEFWFECLKSHKLSYMYPMGDIFADNKYSGLKELCKEINSVEKYKEFIMRIQTIITTRDEKITSNL